MKKTENKAKQNVLIDAATSKGNFADGFIIRNKGNISLVDFIFQTPEKNLRVVSRVMMPKGMLKAVSEEINLLLKEDADNASKENKEK